MAGFGGYVAKMAYLHLDNRGRGVSSVTPERFYDADAGLRRRRLSARAAGFAAAVCAGAILGGFLAFVDRVAEQELDPGRKVDAVVALTGGADRIADALAVVAEGRAGRMLITGVHPQTTEASLARQSGHRDLFACCVDIDRQALNTVGNAREAARWARGHGVTSLLLVTSGYHMPRALIEMRRYGRGIEVVPHPVITESNRADHWWRDGTLARLMFGEYVKYVGAWLRSRIDPRPA